jgi:hypothetical protein
MATVRTGILETRLMMNCKVPNEYLFQWGVTVNPQPLELMCRVYPCVQTRPRGRHVTLGQCVCVMPQWDDAQCRCWTLAGAVPHGMSGARLNWETSLRSHVSVDACLFLPRLASGWGRGELPWVRAHVVALILGLVGLKFHVVTGIGPHDGYGARLNYEAGPQIATSLRPCNFDKQSLWSTQPGRC